MYTDEYYTYTTVKAIELLKQRVTNIDKDPLQEARILDRLCRYCFYVRRGDIAGQAFTNYTCQLCGTEERWANTNVPKVCKPCSFTKNVCVRCRGDINLHA